MQRAADADNGPPAGAGEPLRGVSDVLALFRRSPTLTRAEIQRRTGLARSTANVRIDALIAADLVVDAGGSSTGGRPAGRFAFNRSRGLLLVADIGATGFRTAVCDLAGTVLAERRQVLDVSTGPEPILSAVAGDFATLLAHVEQPPDRVLGVGLDVPGPVDFASGTVVSPPIMTGWDRFDIRSWWRAHDYGCPVLVDKDVNAMAIGEHRTHYQHIDDMIMIKVGTGVGSGLITGGRVHHGADGAAGDIGHIQLTDPDTDPGPECRCGNLGCVEAYAGGWAMLRDMRSAGHDVQTVADVVTALRSGDTYAQRLLRQAGRTLGRAIADAVSLLNPRVVAVGGQLAHTDEQLLAGIREVVYRRSLPLATRKLQIVHSELDPRAGLVGLSGVLTDEILGPQRLEALLDR